MPIDPTKKKLIQTIAYIDQSTADPSDELNLNSFYIRMNKVLEALNADNKEEARKEFDLLRTKELDDLQEKVDPAAIALLQYKTIPLINELITFM